MESRVKLIRKTLGLTQEQLAQRLGIGKAALSMIETGKAGFSTRNKNILVQDLNVNPEWIESGVVDPVFVEEAAMLHDIGVVLCDAPKIHCLGTHAYIEHGYLGAEILRQEGLPKHADVAERHTGTGITYEQIIREQLPIPLQDYTPRTLEERLICYADKFFSKTKLNKEKTIEQAILSLSKFGEEGVRRFIHWSEMFN